MNQTQDQIPIDDAFPVYRQRCNELFDENMLLRSKTASLERRLAAAHGEIESLRQAATTPGGPDLAAQPPYDTDDRG
jgi:hypothetical protein